MKTIENLMAIPSIGSRISVVAEEAYFQQSLESRPIWSFLYIRQIKSSFYAVTWVTLYQDGEFTPPGHTRTTNA